MSLAEHEPPAEAFERESQLREVAEVPSPEIHEEGSGNETAIVYEFEPGDVLRTKKLLRGIRTGTARRRYVPDRGSMPRDEDSIALYLDSLEAPLLTPEDERLLGKLKDAGLAAQAKAQKLDQAGEPVPHSLSKV